jgi:hypothetical protein
MALGVSAKVKQNQDQKMAEMQGKAAPRPIIPVGKAIAVVVTGLVISSIVYHARVGI